MVCEIDKNGKKRKERKQEKTSKKEENKSEGKWHNIVRSQVII